MISFSAEWQYAARVLLPQLKRVRGMLKVATKFTPEAEAFQTASAAGFSYAEFWLDASWLNQWQAVVQLAQQYPLGYALHFPNRGDLSDNTLRQATQLYQQLNCSAMVIHTPMIRRYGPRLLEYDATLRLGVENHRLDLEQLECWAVENTWLTLDVEHLWKFTLEDSPLDVLLGVINDFLSRFRDKLIHVHLPGYAPQCDEHRPMYCSREMVLPVLSLLADYHFDGLIVSEVNAQFQNVHELRMDVLLFQHWQELRQRDETSENSANPHVA
jgi:sugar phosphate isomerase/epimerase